MIILDNLIVFNDGERVSAPEFIDMIKEFDFLYHRNEDTLVFDAVGIALKQNKIVAVFPKNYKYNTNKINEDIQVLSILLKELNLNNELNSYEYTTVSNGNETFLYSCLFIYNYWSKNGDYFDIKKQNNSQNFKVINWKQTISNSYLLDPDNSIINPSGAQYIKDFDSDLAILFKYALRKSLRFIRFLVPMNIVKIENFRTIDESQIRFMLKKLKRSTYHSDKINLINHIENVVIGNENFQKNNKEFFIYSKHFNIAWEFIVSRLLKSEYKVLCHLVPDIKVELDPQYEDYFVMFRQVPDILYIEDKRVVIVDAKYYDVRHTFPNKDDFIKQFFYDITLRTNRIKNNYFVFCGSSSKMVTKIGQVQIENISENIVIKNKIILYVFDTKQAIENYLFHNLSEDYRKELI